MATKKQEGNEPRGLILVYLIYAQVAGVLGAIALAATLGNFLDLDWKSFLGTLVGYWDEYVRPPVKWIFELLITKPLSLFGWHVEIPVLVRDYFSTGFVLFLSYIRVSRMAPRPYKIGSRWFGLLVLSLFIWPALVISTIQQSIGDMNVSIGRALLLLSPILYLALLFAVNYLIL